MFKDSKKTDYLGMVRDFQNTNPDCTLTGDPNEDQRVKISVGI